MTIEIKAELDSCWFSSTYEKASFTAKTVDFIIVNNEVVENKKMKIKLVANMTKAKYENGGMENPMQEFFNTMMAVADKNSKLFFTVLDEFSESFDSQGHRYKLFKVQEIVVKRDTPEGLVTDKTFQCVV